MGKDYQYTICVMIVFGMGKKKRKPIKTIRYQVYFA